MGQIQHVFSNGIADGTNTQLVRPSDWNSNHNYTLQDAVSLSGNTAGVLAAISSGTLYLAGGNNITLSQNANSITISGANAGGAQTGISSVIVSDATYTSGLISFSNQNGVTIGSSVNGASQYVRLSVANQTNQSLGIYASSNTTLTSSGTIDARSLSVRAVGALSVGFSASELVISAAANSTLSATGFLSISSNGSTIFVGAGPLSVYASSNTTLTSSGTIDGNSFSVRAMGSLTAGISAGELILSAPNALTTQLQQFLALTLAGNTAGTSTFHASNNVSLFLNGGNNITLSGNGSTVTISAAAQTVQSIGGYGLGNTTLTSSSTWDARSLSFAGAGAITVGYSSNSGLFISAPATSSLSATGIVSISTNGSTISIGAPGYSGGISTGGNTAGSTGVVSRRVVYAGSNGITLSGSTDAALGSATISILGNPQMLALDPFMNAPVTNSTLGLSTIYLVPFDVPYEMSASRVNFFLSIAATFSGAPANSTAWLAMGYGLYTRMTGASSDRISLATSYSLSYLSASASSSTRLSVTNYIGLSNATSHSTSQYGVQNATVSDYLGSSIGGFRVLALPLNMTLAPGRSWMGISIQSASQGASLIFGHSILQHQYSNNLAYRVLGAVSAASNASFYNVSEGLGIYSAQSAAFPNSIPLTSDSIRGANVQTIPYFNFSGVGTAAGIL